MLGELKDLVHRAFVLLEEIRDLLREVRDAQDAQLKR